LGGFQLAGSEFGARDTRTTKAGVLPCADAFRAGNSNVFGGDLDTAAALGSLLPVAPCQEIPIGELFDLCERSISSSCEADPNRARNGGCLHTERSHARMFMTKESGSHDRHRRRSLKPSVADKRR